MPIVEELIQHLNREITARGLDLHEKQFYVSTPSVDIDDHSGAAYLSHEFTTLVLSYEVRGTGGTLRVTQQQETVVEAGDLEAAVARSQRLLNLSAANGVKLSRNTVTADVRFFSIGNEKTCRYDIGLVGGKLKASMGGDYESHLAGKSVQGIATAFLDMVEGRLQLS